MTALTVTPSSAAEPEPLRPPLKWAGGKRWLLPELRTYWRKHSHRRLVEPLAGGLAVALGLRPGEALLNDLNPHNINFYQWLARGLQVDVEMQNDAETYYRHRTRFNQLIAEGEWGGVGGGAALLLPQSHGLQRALPVQPARRVQRALRPSRDD